MNRLSPQVFRWTDPHQLSIGSAEVLRTRGAATDLIVLLSPPNIVPECNGAGPIRGLTTDPTYFDVELAAGAEFRHSLPRD